MKILDRYIGATIISSTLLFLVMLIGMDFFILCLKELDHIGQGDYGLWQAIIVALLLLPQSLYQFFPMVGLVGSLMGLGQLASHSELIVMRAATMSVGQISRAVLQAALLLLIVATLIGELVAPKAAQLADLRRATAMSGGQAINTSHGIWFRSDNAFIYAEKSAGNNHLEAVRWYRLNSQLRLTEAGSADSADFYRNEWHLRKVARSFIHADNSVSADHLPTMTWTIHLSPRLLSLTQSQASEMSLARLDDYIHYLKQNGLQSTRDSLSFWQRILQPLGSLVMIFLAIPFIFGPLRTVPVGARIVVGCGVGFAFYFTNQLFGPFSLVYQVPPLLAATIPIVICAAVALWLMRRVR